MIEKENITPPNIQQFVNSDEKLDSKYWNEISKTISLTQNVTNDHIVNRPALKKHIKKLLKKPAARRARADNLEIAICQSFLEQSKTQHKKI